MFSHLNKSLLILCIALLSFSANAEPLSKEYQVKAAVLLKLTKFIAWHDDSLFNHDLSLPINICLSQPEPFGFYIDSLAEEQNLGSNKHPMKIMRVSSKDVLSVCHVLFVPKGADLLAHEHPNKILFITDEDSITDTHFHISIYTQNSKIKFAVNIDNVRQDKIKLKSQLLHIAKVVKNSRDTH